MSESRLGTLRELVDLVSAKALPVSGDTELRCINLEDIPEGAGRIVSWTQASDNLSMKTQFQTGDVLFGKLRPYLRKFALAGFDGVCTTEILAFRPKSGIDPNFVFQVVSSETFIEHNVAVSYGTKMPRTDWATAASFPVLIPTQVEQRSIAEVLSAFDEQIEALEREIQKHRHVLDGLIDKLLLSGVRSSVLGDFAEVRPSTKAPLHDSRVPFIPMEAVTEDGHLRTFGARFWSEVSSGFTRFTSGDVLVAKITPCFENGKGAQVPNGIAIGVGSTEFHTLRAKEGVNPRWIYWHTRARAFRISGAGRMTGSAGQQRVPRDFIDSFPVSAISESAQTEAANCLDAIDDLIQSSIQELIKLRLQKQGLTHDLLTGKTRVTMKLEPLQ